MNQEEKDHIICMLKMFYTDTCDLLEKAQTTWDKNAYNDTLEKLDGALDIMEKLENNIEKGRISVLQDFDNLCKADAFMGFTDMEWKAVQKFFAFNKAISKWDK